MSIHDLPSSEILINNFFIFINASPLSYFACSAALIISSATHRITGQAFGLICAPLIALSAPEHIPALILLCGLPVMIYSFKGDWAEIRWNEVSFSLVGRILGSLLAATLIVAIADSKFVSISVALSVLIAVGLSLTRLRISINRATLSIAGFLSGLMATLTSVGAPPMGLLYQREGFLHARATLNAFFLLGALASIATLAMYGLIRTYHVLFAISLFPAMLTGVVIGNAALKRLKIKTLRPFVLTISITAAFSLILREVL